MMAYICVPSGNRGNSGICVGETGLENGEEAEETAGAAGDNL